MAVSLQLYALALFLACLLLSLIVLYSRYRRLSHVPGPLFASFTDLYRACHQNVGNFTSFSLALHTKYGPIVRVGPNTVHISDATAIPAIYTNHGEFQKVTSRHFVRLISSNF